jgi:multicomponent Na+:H+ antiporter subunit B
VNAPILRSVARLLLPLLAVASVFVLLRGHNEPGGGFIGGLVLAGGLALHGLANGADSLRTKLRVDPRSITGAGLVLAIASGLVALANGGTFLEGRWLATPIPGIGKLGTVILFDVGVFLVVLGTTLTLMLALWDDDGEDAAGIAAAAGPAAAGLGADGGEATAGPGADDGSVRGGGGAP